MKKIQIWMMAAIRHWVLAFVFCIAMTAQAVEVSDSLERAFTSVGSVFYKFNYPSVNAAGEKVVLSSSLIAWAPREPKETDSIESLHIYSHYTITADKECPTSNLNYKDRAIFSLLVKSDYALGLDDDQNFISHCVVIAPDYQGYGASRDMTHPYLAQELTARQVMDAVNYGLKLYQKHVNDKRALQFKSTWRSFGYGFSQGAAVALAVQRLMERQGLDKTLRYRGTLCGDGPYDLIATVRYYVDDDGDSYGQKTNHRKGLNTMPMVVPMIAMGMLDTHPDMKGHKLEDYFSQQFLDTGIIDWLKSKDFVVNDIHRKWYKQLEEGLEANGRTYTKEQMAELFMSPKKERVWAYLNKFFTPGLYEYMTNADNFIEVPTEKGDAYKDFHRALVENSVFAGWEPRHRIQFVHSRGDMVVPFSNYLSFRDAHPAGEGDWYRIDESVTPSDHIGVGTEFFLFLITTGTYGKVFQWLDESASTAIDAIRDTPITNHSWFTIDGRKLNGKPTQKGIYIYNGKKIVVK